MSISENITRFPVDSWRIIALQNGGWGRGDQRTVEVAPGETEVQFFRDGWREGKMVFWWRDNIVNVCGESDQEKMYNAQAARGALNLLTPRS